MAFVKTLLIVCIIAVISSCEKNKIINSRRTFFLQDSLFSVDVNVPTELDSFYTWVDRDDYGCGHQRKYRFSDSKYPIFRESGFIKSTYPDSSYRLTFSHVDKYDCQSLMPKVDLNNMIKGFEYRSKQYNDDFSVISSEEMKINGLRFDVLAFRKIMSTPTYQSTLIWGFTKIDTINLKVEYECARRICDSFIEEMKKSFMTIRVKKND